MPLPMNRRLRQERTVFLLFLGTVFVSLMSALPIITATLPTVRYAQAEQHPSVVTFEQLDRNRDGYIDRGEAAALPGLERVFERAERHLAREARWLRELEEVRELEGQVPRVLEEGTSAGGRRYLVISMLPSGGETRAFTDDHARF